MQYTESYESPIGKILLAADDEGLCGLWFSGQKYYAVCLGKESESREIPVLAETKQWLDLYFSGQIPDFIPQIHMIGTAFQKEVWEILLTIPYGQTTTYGEIAKKIAADRGLERMSSQAVGGAVGRNEISIIIPCHRVVGTGGSLTGYAGGIDKKIYLLNLEGGMKSTFFVPRHSTAP